MYIFVNMINSKEFSKRLEQIMQRHDLNASSFAEKVGVGRSSISHILSGRNKPSLDFVLSVLKNFEGVDLYWLLNGKGSYPSKNKPPEEVNKIQKSKPAETESTSSNLFSIQENEVDQGLNQEEQAVINSKQTIIKKGKNITKIIWFYEDGTFQEFDPNQ